MPWVDVGEARKKFGVYQSELLNESLEDPPSCGTCLICYSVLPGRLSTLSDLSDLGSPQKQSVSYLGHAFNEKSMLLQLPFRCLTRPLNVELSRTAFEAI